MSTSALAWAGRTFGLDGPWAACLGVNWSVLGWELAQLHPCMPPPFLSLAAHLCCSPSLAASSLFVPTRLEELRLPVDERALEQAHEAARAAAAAKFERERFGGEVGTLREALAAAIEREYR